MRKSVLAAALAATFSLAACGDEVPYSTYGQQDEAGVIPGLEVSNARMVLAPVEGNPAAIYLDVTYKEDGNVAISGADVEGAGSSEIHNTFDDMGEKTMAKAQPIPVRKGEKVTFAPGGLHIMVMEPSAQQKPGGKVKVTLKIAGARTHEFEAEIKAAGEER